MSGSSWASCVAMAAVVTAFSAQATAQPAYEVLHTFTRPPERPQGPPVEVVSGTFVLPMASGGAHGLGAIVRLVRQTNGSFITAILYSFSGADGTAPGPVLLGMDGALYGTTKKGGAADQGTAFRLTLDGQLTTIHSFAGALAFPDGLLLRTASGSFFGASAGPAGASGNVFVLTPEGAVTTEVRLPRGAGVTQTAAGDIYAFFDKVIYKVPPDPAAPLVVIHRLADHGFGHTYMNLIFTGSDGNFHLTVGSAGNSISVYVLTVTPAGSLVGVRGVPTYNIGSLIEGTDGHLYGATYPQDYGFPAGGTLFRLTKSGAFTLIHYYAPLPDGSSPAFVMQAADGRLYGAANTAGPSNRGSFFEFNAFGFLLREAFSASTPLNPTGTLVRGTDGALWGTSCAGGDYNVGTVFRMTEAGSLSVVHSFRYWDGTCPVSGLVRTSDGTLWGTARSSLLGQGTIFKVSAAGVFTLVRILVPGDGVRPAALLVGSDGNLYGTTTQTDGESRGTVFRITPAGLFSVLHRFTPAAGLLKWPWAGLAQGPDGALYGTTIDANDPPGAVAPASLQIPGGAFRLTLSGEYTEFPFPTDIGRPLRLIGAAGGGFFGVTVLGQLFSMTSNLTPTSLLRASYPTFGDLMQAADGYLYAAAWSSGDANLGGIYRSTPETPFEVLHHFSGVDGAHAFSGLFEAAPGVFYGTTTSGGPGNGGVVFRLSVK